MQGFTVFGSRKFFFTTGKLATNIVKVYEVHAYTCDRASSDYLGVGFHSKQFPDAC
jgi:hypothetical protein